MDCKWRLELCYKNIAQLQSITIPLLQKHPIAALNITNKSNDDNLLEAAKILSKTLDKRTDICIHYAINCNYGGSADAAFSKLEEFSNRLQENASGGNLSILLVTGGGARKKLNTVTALEKASRVPFKSSHLLKNPLYIAFNPYLTGDDATEELKRLQMKLKAGSKAIRGVYLQFGTNVRVLEEKVGVLRQLIDTAAPNTQILGSIFWPSKKLLASLRFRPWKGVFLGDEYLTDLETAQAITVQILTTYKKLNIIPLIEPVDETSLGQIIDIERLLLDTAHITASS